MKTIFNLLTALAVCASVCVESVSAQNAAYQSSITQNLKAPVRIAIDHNDVLYVTDAYQKAIVKYDLQGNYIETITVGGSPVSIAINNLNQIFIGDGESGVISKMESNGALTEFYSGCVFPSSMTFSPEGILYVVDGKSQKVIALDVSANIIQTIGVGTLVFPSEIVYDSRNSRILVAEHGGFGPGVGMSGLPVCKIWKFDLNGVLQGSFASAGNGNGQFYRIQGMAVGKCGNLYVCDPFQGNITVFNESNVFVTRFGQYGTQAGELNVPLDVLFDSQERIIVASMNNGALELFNVADTLPTSNIVNSDATICSNQTTNITIDFTGTAPWTFTYTVDGVNPVTITTNNNPYVLNVNTGGIYEIVALNDMYKSGTCFSGSAKITVNSVIPTSNIPTGNAFVCAGNSLNIPIQFTGASPWTFTYTKDGANPTTILTANNPYLLSASDAGLYEVTAISSGGCIGNTFVGNANISINNVPTASFISSGPSVSVCQGETAILPVQFTGTSPWNISYTIDGENEISYTSTSNIFNLTATQAGLYNLTTVTDANCTSNVPQQGQEVIVKPIPTSVMASINTSACMGYATNIPIQFTGNAPFTFTYSVNNASFITVSTTDYQYEMAVNLDGVYQITSLEGDGCYGTSNLGSATVSLLPLPTAAFTFGNNQVSVCEGQTAGLPISFSGISPWTFTYTTNNINPVTITTADNPYILNVANGGFYEIQSVLDANCYNSSTVGTPEVIVTPLPGTAMNNPTVATCSGTLANIPINFNGIAPWTFVYTIDGLNPTTITTNENPYYISVNTPGLYQVIGISSGNCIGTSMFGNTDLVAAEFPIPSFVYTSNGLEFNFTNNSLYSSSYLWNFGDGQTSTEINPIHQYVAPAIYNVVLTVSNGLCPDGTMSQTLDLTTLNINNPAVENNLLVFPNPSHGYITVSYSNKNSWKLEVINSIGQIVFSRIYNKNKENIDLSQFASGMYTVKVVSDGISKTEKLILNK